MREIDNNINQAQFQNLQKVQATAPTEEVSATAPVVEQKEINDLSSMPSASLGKSQISTDSTEADMQLFMKYPEQVEQMNAIFDKFKENHSYEEATQLLDAYRNEFVAKK